MSITQRTAWLQKHPTPLASAGEFHWYPASDAYRDLHSAFVERMRGKAAPFALWHISRGVVAWAQAFAATAPSDGRHYVGLVVTIAAGDAPASALLAALSLPDAAPWTPATRAATTADARLVGDDAIRDDVGAARSLLSGGVARAAAAGSAALPAWLARFERALDAYLPASGGARTGAIEAPTSDARPGDARPGDARPGDARPGDARLGDTRPGDARTGAIEAPTSDARPGDARLGGARTGAIEARPGDARPGDARTGAIEAPTGDARPGDAALDAGDGLGGPDPIARLCAAVAGDTGDIGEIKVARSAAAWRLACELAGSREALDGVGAAAAQLEATGDGRGVLTAAERERVGDARSVPEILHAWGRGRLDAEGGAATLPARLAELVAWRALAMLAAGRDANAALAEARWQALLPAARRSALFAALVQRAPSLRALALLPARDAISVATRMEVTHA
ncbi:MAG TPA: hypothetical protein VGM88_08585 [Kofleriaceae bacterium]|jgi:hypothetical protein